MLKVVGHFRSPQNNLFLAENRMLVFIILRYKRTKGERFWSRFRFLAFFRFIMSSALGRHGDWWKKDAKIKSKTLEIERERDLRNIPNEVSNLHHKTLLDVEPKSYWKILEEIEKHLEGVWIGVNANIMIFFNN